MVTLNAPIRVLIVNDQREAREMWQLFINMEDDFESVGTAENGLVAVEMANSLQPDVILMDIMMPVMDGIEATRHIRETMSDVVILAYTVRPNSQQEVLEAGANECIPTPLSHREIIYHVRRLVAEKQNG